MSRKRFRRKQKPFKCKHLIHGGPKHAKHALLRVVSSQPPAFASVIRQCQKWHVLLRPETFVFLFRRCKTAAHCCVFSHLRATMALCGKRMFTPGLDRTQLKEQFSGWFCCAGCLFFSIILRKQKKFESKHLPTYVKNAAERRCSL